jgi:hypothetical protein
MSAKTQYPSAYQEVNVTSLRTRPNTSFIRPSRFPDAGVQWVVHVVATTFGIILCSSNLTESKYADGCRAVVLRTLDGGEIKTILRRAATNVTVRSPPPERLSVGSLPASSDLQQFPISKVRKRLNSSYPSFSPLSFLPLLIVQISIHRPSL